MWMPNPSPKGVEEFREILKQELEIELSEQELYEAAAHVLHVWYLKQLEKIGGFGEEEA